MTRLLRSNLSLILLLTALAAMWPVQRAEAIVLASDDFESYAPGSDLNGGSGGFGFAGNWAATGASGGGHTTVAAATLMDPNAVSNGGSQAARLAPTTNLGDIGNFLNRPLPTTSLDTVYMSFLIRPESGVENNEFYNFQASDGATGNSSNALGVGIRNNPGNPFFARVGSSGNSTVNSSTNATLGDDFLLVARFSKTGMSTTYNQTALFINPVDGNEPVVPDAVANHGAPNISDLSLFSVRNFNPDAGDVVWIDNLRFADTFADAVGVTPPAPTGPPMVTLEADADAFVQANQANNNFGSNVELLAKNQGASFSRKSWLRFDLTGVTFDQIAEAELTLRQPNPIRDFGGNANNLTYEFNVFGLNDGDAGEGWDEGAITWNNAPGNDTGSGDGVLANATLLDTFMLTGRGVDGGAIALNSQAILDFITADSDGRVTFIITRETPQTSDSVVHIFNSRETGIGATLKLTAAIPEPATFSLLALGGLAALRRRRRAA